MFIGELCNRDVIIAEKSASILSIAQLMRNHHVGSIVITETQGDCEIPAGIITDRDLVIEIMAKDIDMDSVTAGDIMTSDLATVKESQHIWDTVQLMCQKGIRRMPVVNDENVLIGIITVDDLLDVLISELENISKLVLTEQKKEKRLRQ